MIWSHFSALDTSRIKELFILSYTLSYISSKGKERKVSRFLIFKVPPFCLHFPMDLDYFNKNMSKMKEENISPVILKIKKREVHLIQIVQFFSLLNRLYKIVNFSDVWYGHRKPMECPISVWSTIFQLPKPILYL